LVEKSILGIFYFFVFFFSKPSCYGPYTVHIWGQILGFALDIHSSKRWRL